MKIALIDDYPVILESYTEALAPYHECVTHSDPVDALNDPCIVDADVVFVDFRMPGMSGVDAYWGIRNRNKKAKIAFLTNSELHEVLSAVNAPVPVFLKYENNVLEKIIQFIGDK